MTASNVKTAIYAGSFDPMTNGHMDVLRAGLRIAGSVVVAVGIHPGKTPLFSFDQRKELIGVACDKIGIADRIRITSFDGLVIDAAKTVGAEIMLRGLRDGTDLDYEMQMAGMNQTMAPDLQTIFVPASSAVRSITATLVRQIAAMGGNIDPFVPECVATALKEKYSTL